MARRMRSGTFVGPGTKRKLRPAIRGIAASFEWGRKTKREPAALAEVTPAPPFCTPCAGRATTRSGRENLPGWGEKPVTGWGGVRGRGRVRPTFPPSPFPGLSPAVTPVAPRAQDARLPEVSE